jgi:hypothetical protein
VKLRSTWTGLFLALSAALAQAQAVENVITVGQAIDLSGPNGGVGRDYVAGITTYFDSVNAKGGLNGKKIRYVVRDDRGVPAEAAKLVTGLINEDRADYLMGTIGTDSTRAILAAPAFQQSRHVLFAPLADSFTVQSARAQFWRPSVEREFQFILSYFENLGVKRVGLALQDGPQHARAHTRHDPGRRRRHPHRKRPQRCRSQAPERSWRETGHHHWRHHRIGPVSQGLPQA